MLGGRKQVLTLRESTQVLARSRKRSLRSADCSASKRRRVSGQNVAELRRASSLLNCVCRFSVPALQSEFARRLIKPIAQRSACTAVQ